MAAAKDVTVLVTGYRKWDNPDAIRAAFLGVAEEHPGATLTLVHGGCAGADLLAAHEARRLNWRVIEMKADWSRGKRAGPERNQRMIDTYHPDVALVFMHPESRGTVDCLRRLRAYAETHPKLVIRVVNAFDL